MNWLSEIAPDEGSRAVLGTLVGLVIGLAASAVTLFVGFRQTSAARKSADAAKLSAEAAVATARAAGDRAIATMRLQWVHDLRKILAEYHSVLLSYEAGDRRKVSDLGTQLDLMLNLEEAEQAALWNVAQQIFDEKDTSKRADLDPALMAAGRTVLKNEWKKIKEEQRGLTSVTPLLPSQKWII
ncbi:MAG: hypothetical protein ACTHM2_06430 [Afipia sp.]